MSTAGGLAAGPVAAAAAEGGLWRAIRGDLAAMGEGNAMVARYLSVRIGNAATLEEAFLRILCRELAHPGWIGFRDLLAYMRRSYSPRGFRRDLLVQDMAAIRDRDPACTSYGDILLHYKGFFALEGHRFAHWLWHSGERPFAKLVQRRISDLYGIDIHPGARIGGGIFIDHGTGIVIGETAVIESEVSILHGVTLGGTGKATGKRHPDVGPGVLLGAHCTVLGNIRIGAHAKVGAGSVVLEDVPMRCTVAGVPARVVRTGNAILPSHGMEQDFRTP